eukprot:CAMPEP_0206392146 /NCGR_PEP_ID=MMETSP0294-20121207/19781_1 /ASSEMBLY_ACC=CAM_ASM_000327 /TAXON_ID=39354 /ORGANISM="Heterosigma akashiwo, Strain CCMP2393" /LENGTH=266 /DNA_ID=CAMNT_0053845161 /DNA_START=52 /DNA_END=848 /DNA_ORIENTATION=+
MALMSRQTSGELVRSLRRANDSSSVAKAQKHFNEGLDLLLGKARETMERGRPSTWELEKASIKFKKAIFLDPDTRDYYFARADAALKLHDIRSAVSSLRFALKGDISDGMTRRRLSKLIDLQGLSWLDVGAAAAALALFDAALRLDPVQGPFHVHRALALVRLGDFHQALKAVDASLTCMALTPDHLVLRGKLYWALRLADLGNADFRRAQALAPDHPEVLHFHREMLRQADALVRRGVAALKAGHYAEAIEALDGALGLSPGDLR